MSKIAELEDAEYTKEWFPTEEEKNLIKEWYENRHIQLKWLEEVFEIPEFDWSSLEYRTLAVGAHELIKELRNMINPNPINLELIAKRVLAEILNERKELC